MHEISTTLDTTAGTTLQRTGRHVAWLAGGTIAALTLAGFILGMLAVVASAGELNPFTHLFFLPFMTAVYAAVGGLVAYRHPRNPLGWMLLLVGLSSVLTLLAGAYTQFARYVLAGGPAPIADFFRWLNSWVWWIASILPISLVLLLFPDGRLPTNRWRLVAWSAVIGLALSMLATALHPGDWPEMGLFEVNPYGIENARDLLEALTYASSLLLMVGVFGSLVSVIVRFRRSSGSERTQLKWLAFAAGIVGAGLIAFIIAWLIQPENAALVEASITFISFGVTVIVIAIGIAILRYRLWDIDRLINRTLVYGTLSAIVAGMYVLVVTVFSLLFNTDDNLLLSLFATGLVAVLFQPLRDTVQRSINRLLFGHRDDPYTVLNKLSAQLEPVVSIDAVLPTLVRTIAEALQLPYVAIRLRHQNEFQTSAAYPDGTPRPPDNALESLPLVYQSQTVGQLVFAPRSQGEGFSPGELSLLETIARQAAVAVHNVRLTAALQQSREQLVIAREEERRRLRRDLHDGLGPILASMSFRLDAVNNHLNDTQDSVRQTVNELKTQVQAALADIRRIAYNLRPPALDELGLIGALREHFNGALQGSDLHFLLDAPDHLPALSAAVEVAIYRIAIEAVTNVQRHAAATTCHVRLKFNHEIQLDITDNGRGIASDDRPGVGLTAMHERAAELGGTCHVVPGSDGGTKVMTRIPLITQVMQEGEQS